MTPSSRASPRGWPDLAATADLRADDSDDDDHVLYFADGTPVDAWREDYPYGARLTRTEYELPPSEQGIERVRALLDAAGWGRHDEQGTASQAAD